MGFLLGILVATSFSVMGGGRYLPEEVIVQNIAACHSYGKEYVLLSITDHVIHQGCANIIKERK